MKQKKLKTIIGIITIIFLLNLTYADTNGIWHKAEDVRGGIFGDNEQDITTNYTFLNPVKFLTDIFGDIANFKIINSNKANFNTLNSTNICIGSDCKTSWPLSSFTSTKPPVCTGSNFLQWDGNNWNCKTISTTSPSPSPSPTCTPNSYYSCYSGNIWWYDSCNSRGSLKESCSDGCSGTTCLSSPSPTCTPNSYYSCYSGNIWWYNSCNSRGSLKESCSYGCSGTTCSAPASWYADNYGAFSYGNVYPMRVDITVSSSGSMTGTAKAWNYIYSDGTSNCYYWDITTSGGVYVNAAPGSSPTCANDGSYLTKSEALNIPNVILKDFDFHVSGSMNPDGSFSGTWSEVSGPVNNAISGNGNSAGNQLNLNYIASTGESVNINLNKN